MENKFDAIVIGTGISGGWAAKELTEKGLKTLVLERGRMVRHIEDYPTMNMHPWEFEGGITITQRCPSKTAKAKLEQDKLILSLLDIFLLMIMTIHIMTIKTNLTGFEVTMLEEDH